MSRLSTKLGIITFLFSVFFTTKVFGGGDLQINTGDDDEMDKCGEYCSKTYTAHTNEKSGAEDSCKQGCRLFSIISAVEKMKTDRDIVVVGGEFGQNQPRNEESSSFNETAARKTCENECAEAYGEDKILSEACRDGCRNQTVFTTGRISMVVDDSNPLFPFATKLMQEAMGKFGDVQQRMMSKWDNLRDWFHNDMMSFPFMEDKEKIGGSSSSIDDEQQQQQGASAFFKSLQRVADRLRKFSLDDDDDNDDGDKLISKMKTPRLLGGPEDVGDHIPNHGRPLVATSRPTGHKQGSEFEGPTVVGNEDENGEPIIIVNMVPNVQLWGSSSDNDGDDDDDTFLASEPSPPTGGVMYADPDDGWMACLARRTQNLSIMSRWLLCAALMLSILCTCWLCLALTRNQRNRRRRLYMKYNEAGKSDVVYFMPPPPVYNEKCSTTSSAYIPLGNNEAPEGGNMTPPPAYENTTAAADIPPKMEEK